MKMIEFNADYEIVTFNVEVTSRDGKKKAKE